jgi:hypothetical protein
MILMAHLRRTRELTQRATSWTAVSLPALLVAWTAAMLTPSASAAAGPPAVCHADASIPGCMRATAIAHASDNESEGESEGLEEELEEGAEEAASAEVETEEMENGTDSSPSAGSSSASAVVLSHLQLTAGATAALAHRLPSVSAIGFSFTLSAPARVQVTLLRQANGSARTRWIALPDSLTLSVAKGHVTRSLRARKRLTAGRYRLTLKPANSRARAIYLSVRR